MDTIRIDELKIYAYHGVFPEENAKGQNFYVNAVIYTDTEKAGALDDLDCSVNYADICACIKKVMTANTYRLIETAAQAVAYAILKEYDLISATDIEVRKPEAPINMEFGSVSVSISRGWHTAVIALGSNMGDKRAYIDSAVKQLAECPEIKDIRVSSLMETKPYGYTEQGDFLNGALLLKTLYSPHKLLELMHEIEQNANRKREIHWGPRTIDLDLIFYDNEVIADSTLNVPHPDMHNRRFVLAPVAELAPWYLHPLKGLTVAQMLAQLPETDGTDA